MAKKKKENGDNLYKSLETWLWDAACTVHDPVDAPKYKDYILPLVFVKRLCDVFDEFKLQSIKEVETIISKVQNIIKETT